MIAATLLMVEKRLPKKNIIFFFGNLFSTRIMIAATLLMVEKRLPKKNMIFLLLLVTATSPGLMPQMDTFLLEQSRVVTTETMIHSTSAEHSTRTLMLLARLILNTDVATSHTAEKNMPRPDTKSLSLTK